MMSAISALAGAQPSPASGAIEIYAAGSLREAFERLYEAYRAQSPLDATFIFGPSGRLRERIQGGAKPALFASAAPEHTEALRKNGLLRNSILFASNRLCLLTQPGVTVSPQRMIDVLLDPNVRVATSTPGADPAGDYAWQLFRNIDAVRPGSFAVLDAKAKKLVGADIAAPTASRSVYADLLLADQADLFVTYCTNAATALKAAPQLRRIDIPIDLNVIADYSLGLTPSASDQARFFVRYIQGERGQALLASLGFAPPRTQCEDLSPGLSMAQKSWSEPNPIRAQAIANAQVDALPLIEVGRAAALSLIDATLAPYARKTSPSREAAHAGSFRFTAQANGHHEVFLDQRAWIDVVRERDGMVAESIRSERWLGCAGVGKNLGFRLDAGEKYRLQLSELGKAEARLLIHFFSTTP